MGASFSHRATRLPSCVVVSPAACRIMIDDKEGVRTCCLCCCEWAVSIAAVCCKGKQASSQACVVSRTYKSSCDTGANSTKLWPTPPASQPWSINVQHLDIFCSDHSVPRLTLASHTSAIVIMVWNVIRTCASASAIYIGYGSHHVQLSIYIVFNYTVL